MTIFHLENTDKPRVVRMTFAAADQYVLDIERLPSQDYDDFIADLCRMGPILMRLDTDLAEAYDNAFRTKPNPSDEKAMREFRQRYKGQITDIEGSLEFFE